MANRSTLHQRSTRKSLSRAFRALRARMGRRGGAMLAAVMLGMAGLGNAAALPEQFTAHYEVSHRGLTLGEATVEYQQFDGNRYRYDSVSRTVGLAKLFYNATIRERSEGVITEEGFKPERYTYKRTGKDPRQALLVFDWGAGRVINDVAGSAWRMAVPTDAMDRMVSQLQLMHDLAARQFKDLVYTIADGGELKTYQLEIVGGEDIQTPYGTFETLKINELRDDNKRATVFWVAPELDYLAVRIEHRDRDDRFFMNLKELKGFERTAAAGEKSKLDVGQL